MNAFKNRYIFQNEEQTLCLNVKNLYLLCCSWTGVAFTIIPFGAKRWFSDCSLTCCSGRWVAIVTTSKKETPIAWVSAAMQRIWTFSKLWLMLGFSIKLWHFSVQCVLRHTVKARYLFPKLNETNQKTGNTSAKHKVNLLTNKSVCVTMRCRQTVLD